MKYDNCPLYNLQSKRFLRYLLRINDNRFFNQDYVASLVSPYIDTTNKPRLIEPPQAELKIIQKRIKTLLGKIDVPDNVFSGIKGRSYANNVRMHQGEDLRLLFKVDMRAFFPSISRETVYKFFAEDLRCAPDIACILTNFTTIDLEKSNTKDLTEVLSFLASKNVSITNHLISGAPTSQILSYLANHAMFDEMQVLADNNDVKMSVYVDDITFSSNHHISRRFKNSVFYIIKKYNYQVSKNKVKSYTRACPKLVTGVIIDSTGKLTVKNSLRKKIIDEYDYLRTHPSDKQSRQRLLGLLGAAHQADKSAYPNIYKFAQSDISSPY